MYRRSVEHASAKLADAIRQQQFNMYLRISSDGC